MEERSQREKRKNEHIQLALKADHASHSDFDDLHFLHRSLPEAGIEEVDLSTQLGGITLDTPLYINAMTGGSQETKAINASLAEAAKETGIAMAVGSQHSGLRDETLRDTYQIVRQINPEGVVLANVGADVPAEYASRAVEMLEANALQIHLNVPQEIVMAEGERDFSGWLSKVEKIISQVSVPVIVKETGFGMCRETLAQLKGIGVQYVDVGGGGGTNFIHIENERREKRDFSYLRGWGQSTPISLLESQSFLDDMTILASGGIRHPLDAVKCFALGAKAAGAAGVFLRELHSSGTEGLIETIQTWKHHMKAILLMQGARSIAEIQKSPIVAANYLRDWCELRGINIQTLANRNNNGMH